MSENSMIQWTDYTFNPENLCGPNGNRIRTKSVWRDPLKWNKAVAEGRSDKDKVFCASMADVFEEHDQIVSEWREDLFSLIEKTKHLQWLLLTKRPENVKNLVPWHWILRNAWPSNVWIGTTVENQAEYDKRVPHLMKLPAPIRFVSMEPLLGHITITDELDWIIIGGESGKADQVRPMPEASMMHVLQQANEIKIPVFMKQLGTAMAKKYNLKHKKGGDPNEWPWKNLSLLQQFDFPVEYARRKVKL